MGEEDFVFSSQLAFSDETKEEGAVITTRRPTKRKRLGSEDHDAKAAISEQRSIKRRRAESAGFEKDGTNESIDTCRSPTCSKASSYHRNPECTIALPQPIPFLLPEDASPDPSVHSDPQHGAIKSIANSHSIHARQFQKSSSKCLISSSMQEIQDIPSPPVFSSDEDVPSHFVKQSGLAPTIALHRMKKEEDLINSEYQVAGDGFAKGQDNATQKREPFRFIEETGAPPTNSRNSSYFSFSRVPPSLTGSSHPGEMSETKVEATPHLSIEDKSSKRYYLRAFDYVVREVLARNKHILNGIECKIVTLIKSGISFDAKALFVRIYRRTQPQWYRVKGLEESYDQELNVTAAVEELCRANIVISSEYASQGSELAARVLARDLLPTLNLDEVKKLCDCLVDSRKLKRLPKNKLIPNLRRMLLSSLSGKKATGKALQMTLTGLTPSQLLSRAVLKKAGHSIRIPDHVLTSLEKVHFLFFLEEGHDSPNIILADTGKAKFPDYQCHPASTIFPSRNAFDDYRKALSLEQELDKCLTTKAYFEAVNLGSIAELEVREFFERPRMGYENAPLGKDEKDQTCCASLAGCGGSKKSFYRKEKDRINALNQLHHPFFRRYTAQWVYVRACYHSVHAFECLREYESAVELLKLLLSTYLVPKRRGKCLNRITINMFKHLGKPHDALNIIEKALDPKEDRLHLGDRLALARRGAAICRKLKMSSKRRKPDIEVVDEDGIYTTEEPRTVSDVAPELPENIAVILKESGAKVRVRKIYGKSLNVQAKEFQTQNNEEESAINDPWYQNMVDRSGDSQQSMSSRSLALNSRALFSSFRRDGGNVSVEEYCLEWYFGKEGWCGIHDEGKSIRFLFSLFMWESALFAFVPDVFQTPFQDKPLDLFTEAFYQSRSEGIENRLQDISVMSSSEVFSEVESCFERYNGTRAIGCDWNSYTASNLAAVGAGLGGSALSHCFRLLSQDYNYWAGGLPDLTLWKELSSDKSAFATKLVEVKSARDTLSERQKAWLLEIEKAGVLCEVCKVVESKTSANARDLEEARLDEVSIEALNAASADKPKKKS
ncbi:Fanconi-associated nuclease 1-like protein [Gracilaria domingensis]|nr:Fanconi-associated nuclease 1-like protein [Gracilaria domingensis]